MVKPTSSASPKPAVKVKPQQPAPVQQTPEPEPVDTRNASSVKFGDRKTPPPTLPDVRALILKYKPNRGSEVDRPAERVLKAVATVDAFLSGASSAKELAKKMVEQDLRTPLFQLEGLLRIYEPKLGKRFEKRLDKVKDLEDQLGAVGFARDALGEAEKAKLPAAAIAVLKGKLEEQQDKLEKLVEKRWIPEKRGQADEVDELVGAVLDAKFGNAAEDQLYLRAELSRRLEKVSGTTYDFTELQAGVHELRRDLRWLPIYMQALDGAIQLSDRKNQLPALAALLQTPAASSPFLRTSGPEREASTIVLSKSLMIANSNLIQALGAFKDTGEYLEALTLALLESKSAKGHPEAVAMARKALKATDSQGFLEGARDAYSAFKKQGVLGALVTELRA